MIFSLRAAELAAEWTIADATLPTHMCTNRSKGETRNFVVDMPC